MSALAGQRRMEVWRRCLGLCCVCGEPMACPRTGVRLTAVYDADDTSTNNTNHYYNYDAADNNYNNNGDGGGDNDGGAGGGGGEGGGRGAPVVPIDSDGRLLTEEEPTRLALLRFNALGEYQFAHVVDDYTFLEKRRNGATFRKEFTAHRELVVATHPEAMTCFEATVLDPTDTHVYDAAVATNRRVAERLTIPSCRHCNKAMDREGAHVLATYRCFELTRDSDVPGLESTSKKAIAAKKVVQQIAFYFKVQQRRPSLPPPPPPQAVAATATATATATANNNNKGKRDLPPPPPSPTPPPSSLPPFVWSAKTEDQLLRDASMWRCIAHLWNWGCAASGGGVRFRMVAVFHAAYYIYLQSSARDLLSFEAWHVHCWRPYYAARFAADSFLGMRQAEAGPFFDLTRKKGEAWQERVHARTMQVMDGLEAFYSPEEFEAIVRFEEATTAADIQSEGSLLRFLMHVEARRRRRRARASTFSSSASLLLLLPRWLEEPQQQAAPHMPSLEKTAVAQWLRFFHYNLSSVQSLLAQCEPLARELSKTLGVAVAAVVVAPRASSFFTF
jgi:hypothetical protein